MATSSISEQAIHAGFIVSADSIDLIKHHLLGLKNTNTNEYVINADLYAKWWRTDPYFACIHVTVRKICMSRSGEITSRHVEDWYRKWSAWSDGDNYSQAIINSIFIKHDARVIGVNVTISGQPFILTLATNGSIRPHAIKTGSCNNAKRVNLKNPIKFDVEPYIHRQIPPKHGYMSCSAYDYR